MKTKRIEEIANKYGIDIRCTRPRITEVGNGMVAFIAKNKKTMAGKKH